MKKLVIILTLLLFSSVLLFLMWDADPLTSRERTWLKQHGAVKVVYSDDYPPLNFVDPNGGAQGIRIDYWRLLASKMGFDVKFYPNNQLSRQLEGVRSDQFDSLAGIFPLKEYAGDFDFSQQYMSINTYIFVRAKHSHAKSFTDIRDLKVGVVESGSGQVWSEAAGLSPTLFANYTDTILALIKADMDAIVMDEPIVGYISTKYKFEGKIVRGLQVDQSRMILAVKKGNKVLLDILNKGVAAIAPEELRNISIKWFTEAPICKECRRKFQSLIQSKK